MSNDDSGLVRELRERIAKLEAEARIPEQLLTEVEESRIDRAIREAGYTLNATQRDAVLAVIDDVTPEAIRGAVSEIGIGGMSLEDVAALDRVNATEAGATAHGPEKFADLMNAARSQEEALAVMAQAGYRPEF